VAACPHRAVAAVVAVLLAAWTPPVTRAQDPVFRAGVEQVRVDTSVTRGNTPVGGLKAEHFEVHDNGVVYPVEHVLQEDVPLRLLLVLDTSGSLEGPGLRALMAAAHSLVRSLRPEDEVGLVTFSQVLRLSVAPTPRHAEVIAALGQLSATGATAWRDALFAGLQLAGAPAERRPLVLLFTDGEDNASWMDPAGIDDAVRRSGVVVHAVGLNPRDRRIGRNGLSRSLILSVDAGGGRFWGADDPEHLGRRFADVLREMRARYLLFYTPKRSPEPGWHDVKVRLKGARGDVKARPGYYVPAR
jgi:VWFA-related protein